MNITLTTDQITHFHEQGYLQLERITSDQELADLRLIYDRIFREKIGWQDGLQFDLGGNEEDDKPVLPQILNPSRYFPELQETHFARNVRSIAKQLYADIDPEFVGEHMIYKPAIYGGPTPWHQDQAYHAPDLTNRGINFWMPLDDATIENGCMHFVPGSHKLDVLPHHSINNDPRVHGLEVDDPERWHTQAVAAPFLLEVQPCMPTTCSIMPPQIPHRGRAVLISAQRAPQRSSVRHLLITIGKETG